MPEKRARVQPIQVTYICDVEDCGEEQIARDGFSNSRGEVWRHRCKNNHVKDDFAYGVKYPRIEYEVIPTYVQFFPCRECGGIGGHHSDCLRAIS